MSGLHETIRRLGLEAVRREARSKAERRAVEAAAVVLARPPTDLAYGSLSVTGLPHRDVRGTAEPWRWSQETPGGRYVYESGAFPSGEPIGLPYGSKGRVIILFHQSEAMRMNSRVVALGASFSLYGWIRAMTSSPIGGMTYQLMMEQGRRAAAVRMDDSDGLMRNSLLFNGVVREDQPKLLAALVAGRIPTSPFYLLDPRKAIFPANTVLSQPYFDHLLRDAVPLRATAVQQLSSNSIAVDAYIWLASRLKTLRQPELVRWMDLRGWFGAGYRHSRQMKPSFLRGLELALAVYPEAEVEVVAAGLRLHPSPAPIQAPQANTPAVDPDAD